MSKDAVSLAMLAVIAVWMAPVFFAGRFLEAHPWGHLVLAVSGVVLAACWVAVNLWAASA